MPRNQRPKPPLTYTPGDAPCRGQVYRGYRYAQWTSRGPILEIKLQRLVTRSCTGCPDCILVKEHMFDACGWSDGTKLPHGYENIRHKTLYTLKLVNLLYDRETGYVDSYDVELVEVEENHNNPLVSARTQS